MYAPTNRLLTRVIALALNCLLDIKDFILVAIHTSPINAPQEIDELVNVYHDVVTKFNIPDVIILGDLNAACSYFSDMDRKKN